jgi:hypothetical protein
VAKSCALLNQIVFPEEANQQPHCFLKMQQLLDLMPQPAFPHPDLFVFLFIQAFLEPA